MCFSPLFFVVPEMCTVENTVDRMVVVIFLYCTSYFSV